MHSDRVVIGSGDSRISQYMLSTAAIQHHKKLQRATQRLLNFLDDHAAALNKLISSILGMSLL